jgi:PAS domain S-box-containing protein
MEFLVVLIIAIAFISVLIFREKNITQELLLKTKELEATKSAYDSMFNHGLHGIVLWNENFYITAVNTPAQQIMEYEENELLGKHITDIINPYDYDLIKQDIRKKSNHAHKINISINNKKTLLVYITNTKIIQNDEIVYVTFMMDLTELNAKEEELQRLNFTLEERIKKEVQNSRDKDQKMLQQSRLAQMGEMISMIAHQWRQPLTAISATTNNLTFKLMLDDVDKEFFKTEVALISEYTQHLSKTIDDFKDFFKDNKLKETVPLTTIIEDTLYIIEASIRNKNIELITNFQCDDEIETYPSEIKQVLLNLIKNAEDALLEKEIDEPKIVIETKKIDENTLVVSVQDNARGIPINILDKLFEPYFSTKKEKDGTGLGLYMSKTIIEKHCGGEIVASNKDDGALFCVTLYKDAL